MRKKWKFIPLLEKVKARAKIYVPKFEGILSIRRK